MSDKTDTERFQLAGWRTEAANLKKRVREQETLISVLNQQIVDMTQQAQDRFNMILFPRKMALRREHLITLHNVMEHCRKYGTLTPLDDFSKCGFNDHRTLQRSCNKFVEEGLLVKIKGNPVAYALPGE